jgi:hypothetical protein
VLALGPLVGRTSNLAAATTTLARRHRPAGATAGPSSDLIEAASGLAASRSERAANDQYDHSGSVGSIRM